MTNNSRAFGSSVKFKHVLGASASALAMTMMSSAFAQPVEEIPDAAASEAGERDTIVVTGSRIRRPVDTTIDVSTITSEEFDDRAFTNPLQAIDDLPIGGFGNFSPNNQGANTQRGDNGAFPDLLNIGTNRTLTLVDGRRFVGSTQATVFVPGNANGVQVDLSIINPELIERTEVLTVGGGPIYGADAVAGVVNIILKDDFEGLKFRAQGGITQEGDGENYRFNGIWGKNFDRGNITVTGEYLKAERIQGKIGGDRPLDKGISDISNPLSAGNSDGTPSNIFIEDSRNPLDPLGGLVAYRSFLNINSATPIYPNNCTGAAATAFCGATGMTPFEYGQTNPNVDPNLFIGTFANRNATGVVNLPAIANPDAATNAFLPWLAVPLVFNDSGALVPYNFGSIVPPNPAAIGEAIGGGGINAIPFTNIQSGQERWTGNMSFKYELADNITFKTNLIYSHVESDSVGLTGSGSNNLVGGSTSGTRSVPIYIDQNPFVTPAALATLNQLAADGAALPTLGGERVIYLSTNVADVISADAPGTGGIISGDKLTTWRTANVVEGEFEKWGRQLYWDVSFVYGVTTAKNFTNNDILDIEFWLATDVVDDGTGNAVCRQQTLGAPEALPVRNPDTSQINTGLPTPLTPTQAQIDACVPLNLFGSGGVTQAAIDYVTAPSDNNNKSQQFYGAASFGGELFQLPAGPMLFNSQFEWRKETNQFDPGPVFGLGLGRSTTGQPSQGSLRFFEGGTEFIVPIFGGDVRPFAFNELELNGAVRVVNRSISSDLNPAAAGAPSPTDVTFTAGGRWSPFEGVTIRGNRTRSVRSPSVVELVGAGVTGFTGGADADFACDADNVDSDISSVPAGTRRANCRAWVIALGLAADNATADTFLNGFQIPNSGSRPAAGGSNVGLSNERADNWTVGIVLQPDFIPGLTIESDWYAIDVKGLMGLTFIVNQCFDSTTFPNSPVGGFNACDSVVPNVSNGMGGFIVPSIHPITGNPVPPVAQPGTSAVSQVAGHNAFVFFPTVNQGLLESRALNNRISYNFELADLFGESASSWGDATITGHVLYYPKLSTDDNEAAGEHGQSIYSTRLDFTHRLGGLTHTVQWFRQSGTVGNVAVAKSDYADQIQGFVRPAYNTFNYNVRYDFNDNITARFVVNNLTNNYLSPELGLFIGDPIGRRFVGSLEFNF